MADAASRSRPSIAHPGPCRPDLNVTKSISRIRGGRHAVFLRTEADARVLLTNVLALLIGEEHVGREATLGRVGICEIAIRNVT